MNIRLIGITLFFLTLTSCGDKEEKLPEHIWNEDRMVEVLTEIQKTEAFVRLRYHHIGDSAYVDDSVFNATFQQLGTSREEYDSNYSYYLNHPKKLEKVYEEVIINLNEASGELENEIKK